MKINCLIGPFFPVPPLMGGAVERIHLALCREYARRGHDVSIISRQYGDLPHSERREGMDFIRIPSFNAPKSKILYRIFDIIYSLRAMKAIPPGDIIITNSVFAPLVLNKRKAGKIYISVARFPKGQMGIYRKADRIQCVSSHISQAVTDQSPELSDIVKTIPNAINDVFVSALSAGEKRRENKVVYVGRIAREKGIELLIRAFVRIAKDHPAWRLDVIGPEKASQGGDGEQYLNELKGLAAEAGQQIRFLGPIFDEKRLVEEFSTAEIFVYPSIAAMGEALPLAPVEAMACGAAVLVSKLDCFGDYLVDGENGLYFDQADKTGIALAATLGRMISDDGMRASLRRGGKLTAARYVPGAVADLFLEDFQSLVKGL